MSIQRVAAGWKSRLSHRGLPTDRRGCLCPGKASCFLRVLLSQVRFLGPQVPPQARNPFWNPFYPYLGAVDLKRVDLRPAMPQDVMRWFQVPCALTRNPEDVRPGKAAIFWRWRLRRAQVVQERDFPEPKPESDSEVCNISPSITSQESCFFFKPLTKEPELPRKETRCRVTWDSDCEGFFSWHSEGESQFFLCWGQAVSGGTGAQLGTVSFQGKRRGLLSVQDVTEHLEGLAANYLRLHVSGEIQEMSKHHSMFATRA